MSGIKLFGLGASQPQADAVAAVLDIVRCNHEEREFEDGEHKARPLESVRGDDVYVLHSLHADGEQSANDKLCRLLFFLATVRAHGAARVTAVTPYLCYARKDRRTKSYDPVITRYVAQLFEAVGVDRVVAIDVHNPAAFENAFRCNVLNLEALPLFATHMAAALRGQAVTVLSPDAGGIKRAEALRRSLSTGLAQPVELGLMEKQRSDDLVSGEALFADVAGRSVVIIDDLIGTGTTLLRAARAARAAGAKSIMAAASHGLFLRPAGDTLADPVLDRIVITDSVPPFRLQGHPALSRRVTVLPSARLLAQAIRGLHENQSTELDD